MKIQASTPLRRSLLAAGIASFTAITSHAAIITWNAPKSISGDSDVSTTGTLVNARNFGGTGVASATVSGVTFQPFVVDGTASSYTAGNATYSTLSVHNPNSAITSTFQALSPGYNTLVTSATTLLADKGYKLTLSGLTVGQKYQFQMWVNDSSRTYPGPVSATGTEKPFPLCVTDGAGHNVLGLYAGDIGTGAGANGANRPPTPGQYVLGSFSADAVAQQIEFGNPGHDGVINGFQLRALPGLAPVGPVPVPEPGSALAGMLALGACLSGLVRRNRRQPEEA